MTLAVLDHISEQPALPGLELGPVGITQTGELAPETITAVLTHLRRAEAAWNWIAGDLVLAAIHEHGPTRGLGLITDANLYQAHLSRCAAVAQRIPHKQRHPALSWSHHELVAGAPTRDQTRLLDLAETEQLSVRQLKALIDQERNDLNPQLALPPPPKPLALTYKTDPDMFCDQTLTTLTQCAWISDPHIGHNVMTGQVQITFTLNPGIVA